MKKCLSIVIALIGAGCVAYGQAYAEDAIRFSQNQSISAATARMQAVGGGHVSLGGDMSSIAFNPAGLGFYNRSSAGLTLGGTLQESDDTYLGQTTANLNSVFTVNQGAVVLHLPSNYTEGGFQGSSLGLAFSRVSDFNRDYRYEGRNTSNSLVDFFLDNATDLNLDNLDELTFAAYDQFLIDFADFNTNSDYIIDDAAGTITPELGDGVADGYTSLYGSFSGFLPNQTEIIDERGNQYKFNISWGGNYEDRFYFGAALGIETIYYSRERRFTESAFQNAGVADDLLRSISLTDRLVTRGGGANLTLGGIFRPMDILTFGLSFQTPTFLTLREESEFTLSSDWNDFTYVDAWSSGDSFNLDQVQPYRSSIFETRYDVRTPSRITGGATVFINKAGFITVDAEWVDYSNTRLTSNDFSTQADNDLLNTFESVINVRAGAEYRLKPLLLRAGYAYAPDPLDAGRDQQFITVGAGYRQATFYLDVALILSDQEQTYTPYTLSQGGQPIVESEINTTQLIVTTGFNF